MIRRLMAATALLALAACASSEEAAPYAAPAPPPPQMSAAPAAPPPAGPAPGVAAPGVQAPEPPRAPPPRGDLVVPGQVEREVAPPTGDPRSVTERVQDIRAWDTCVMRAQGMGESDPMRPQMDSPEEICRTQLGMANRTAVPSNRRP